MIIELILLSIPHMMLPYVRIGSILESNKLIASLTETFPDVASAFLMLKIALRALVALCSLTILNSQLFVISTPKYL